ncbi:hypothetical protein [Flavobacterium sp. N3904]|uniref:hypothetical protein n=1 Tax=Flavobacterium sp. N3904 TaxID=2986835 RepID=UPI002225A5B6|nr:hypothetical protein [Flavobacterium sp. N3904]
MTNEEKIGDLMNKFNNLEIFVNHTIGLYFSPAKHETEFYNILLNGTVVGFGQKMKILANMENIENKLLSMLTDLMSIRNAVAHNNPYMKSLDSERNFDAPIFQPVPKKYFIKHINVMNSSGKIKTKDFEEEYDKFNNLLDEVIPTLQKFNLALATN